MTLREGIYAILRIARRELRRLVANPVYFFCMVVAPVGCLFFFTTLMRSGLPTDLPVADLRPGMSVIIKRPSKR